MARHGRGHRINPSEVNHRANIFALKTLGVEQIISVGLWELKEELRPRDMVFPDQIYDRTKGRASTFFEKGIVAHVGVANPIVRSCPSPYIASRPDWGFAPMRGELTSASKGRSFRPKRSPACTGRSAFRHRNDQRSGVQTRAGSGDRYASVALVTDYDVWHEEPVTVEMVIGNLNANTANVKKLLSEVVAKVARERNCECASALQYAILTIRSKIPAKIKKDLKPLVGKYLS